MRRRFFLPALLLSAAPDPIHEVVELVNRSRARARLRPLRINAALARAAQARATHMAKNNYFSHTSPDTRSPWSFVEATGYRYRLVGENIAQGQAPAARRHEMWMNSPAHRANILNPAFTETGVGIARVPEGNVVVQLFAAPQ